MSEKPAGVALEAILTNSPWPGSIWRHWKGAMVQVIGMGHHTETGQAIVLYKHEINNRVNFWARPLSMWDDEARPGIKRFVYQPE